jgi:hypothetical protein
VDQRRCGIGRYHHKAGQQQLETCQRWLQLPSLVMGSTLRALLPNCDVRRKRMPHLDEFGAIEVIGTAGADAFVGREGTVFLDARGRTSSPAAGALRWISTSWGAPAVTPTS